MDTKLGEFLGKESVQECVVDDDAVGEADCLVTPLPDLETAQFGHRRVLEVSSMATAPMPTSHSPM